MPRSTSCSGGNLDQAGAVLEKAMSRTRLTIGELRDLSFNLEPVVLRDHGFAMAVSALAQNRGIEHGIHVDVDAAAAEILGERSQAALYQIVREAFEGPRSGEARRQNFSVRVVKLEDGALEATITDDAPGERRKRSIEVLEEARPYAARSAHRRAGGRRDDDCVSCSPPTPAPSKVPADMADGHLLFVWKTSGYELREQTATCRPSARRSRRTGRRCSSPRSGPRRCRATRVHARI